MRDHTFNKMADIESSWRFSNLFKFVQQNSIINIHFLITIKAAVAKLFNECNFQISNTKNQACHNKKYLLFKCF